MVRALPVLRKTKKRRDFSLLYYLVIDCPSTVSVPVPFGTNLPYIVFEFSMPNTLLLDCTTFSIIVLPTCAVPTTIPVLALPVSPVKTLFLAVKFLIVTVVSGFPPACETAHPTEPPAVIVVFRIELSSISISLYTGPSFILFHPAVYPMNPAA